MRSLTIPLSVIYFSLLAFNSAFALEVSGWVADGPDIVPVRAAYLSLSNSSEKSVIITGFHSAHFEKVELHESKNTGDRATMVRVEKLKLAPGRDVIMAPGGLHIMLYGPKGKIAAGDCVELTIEYAEGEAHVVRLPVNASATPVAEDHSGH